MLSKTPGKTSPAEPRGKVAEKRVATIAVRLSDAEVNRAPLAWGRRVARVVGAQMGVEMSLDRAKNEGTRGKTRVAIKCAKSRSAPIIVSQAMLGRVKEVWGVFLVVGQGAEIWKCDAAFVRRAAYFNTTSQKMVRAELRFKAMQRGGTLIGHLSEAEVEACEIP